MPARPSKREYEELLNQVFGTNIKWSKLSIRELEELANVLTDDSKRSELCNRLQCSQYRYLVLEIANKLIPPEKQGPLLKGLRLLLEGGHGAEI